ncbi:hypothetical protein M422DRAFT_259331 [Sphaerobolus stellatus SS14]|uniref:Uncharacterized protein n=1 Tax=Sphaerobolus stellatus (strain SS14) TaxID=990650 RepID=A0A0C9UTG7_SPHS4|nr:hypothetical protein M422DRAFT_259331 [Sphaerobolus stellatus SS14]
MIPRLNIDSETINLKLIFNMGIVTLVFGILYSIIGFLQLTNALALAYHIIRTRQVAPKIPYRRRRRFGLILVLSTLLLFLNYGIKAVVNFPQFRNNPNIAFDFPEQFSAVGGMAATLGACMVFFLFFALMKDYASRRRKDAQYNWETVSESKWRRTRVPMLVGYLLVFLLFGKVVCEEVNLYAFRPSSVTSSIEAWLEIVLDACYFLIVLVVLVVTLRLREADRPYRVKGAEGSRLIKLGGHFTFSATFVAVGNFLSLIPLLTPSFNGNGSAIIEMLSAVLFGLSLCFLVNSLSWLGTVKLHYPVATSGKHVSRISINVKEEEQEERGIIPFRFIYAYMGS